mgnify:CR=1 FL=1
MIIFENTDYKIQSFISGMLSNNSYLITSKTSKKNIIICLDGDAWEDAKKLYRKLEGGRLNGRIKLLKVPKDKDVGELGGIKGLKEITLL